MELLILVLLGIGFIGNAFVMRWYFKQLSKKLSSYNPLSSEIPASPPVENSPLQKALFQTPSISDMMSKFSQVNPAGSQNEVMQEDGGGLEFDENIPFAIPKNVKFEVEGGDTQMPPGFQPNGMVKN